MASLDKLVKSFETLKIQMHNENVAVRKQEMQTISKKEKILHLNLIHESVVSPAVKQTNEFNKVLSHAIETFIIYFDDDDQDVFFAAEDCLNKTVKCLIETHVGRLKIELYRFIRRNESEKCLKAALTRFAELCHLIRPQKCRQFAEFFIKENPMKKIAMRQEESIQNILISVMTKLCSSLCCCMMDNEIKSFMDAFIPNLSNESSVNSYRRVAAVCLTLICLYSKNPFNSFHVLYEECFKLLFQKANETGEAASKFTIWGVLICFRNIIIHISELEKVKANVESPRSMPPNTFSHQTVCEIYEICLMYLDHEDSSVVSASLECLQALMKHQPFDFGTTLTTQGSFKDSLLKNKKLESTQTPPIALSASGTHLQSSSTKVATILNADDFKLNEFSTNLDSNLSLSSESLMNLMPAAPDRSASDIDPGEIEDTLNSSMSNREVKFDFDQTAPDETDEFQDQNEASGETPLEQSNQATEAQKDLTETIGAQFSDTEPALTYLTRLLCHKYLLGGEPGLLKPDKSVKVLVKAVALDCISHAVSLMPDLVSISLSINPNDSQQHIYDLITYIKHSDDKMKSNACMLIGTLIGAVLMHHEANYDKWLNSQPQKSDSLQLETLLNHLLHVIKLDSSNMTKKSAVSSLQLFLPALLGTKHAPLALNIIQSLLSLRNSSYNLVKCELVQLLALLDYKLVRYAEETQQEASTASLKSADIQERVLREVFFHLLSSEDNKLRLETAKALTHLAGNLCFYEVRKDCSGTQLLVAHSKSLVADLNLINSLNNSTVTLSSKFMFAHLKANSYLSNFVQPFHKFIQQSINAPASNTPLEHNLAYIIPLLMSLLVESSDKYLLVGCLESIDYLLQVYDATLYLDIALIQDLLNLLQAFLGHSLIAYDLYLHEILLKLIGNLYSSLICKTLATKFDITSVTPPTIDHIQRLLSKRDTPFYLLVNNPLLANYANKFYTHNMRLLCIIACVLDENSLPSSLTSNLSAGSNYVSNTSSILTPKNPDESSMDATATNLTSPPSQSAPNPQKADKETFLGFFQNSSFYMKIYEATKVAYASWKKSSHVGAYDKFSQFVKSTLSLFAQLLESSLSANELARHLDETLLYLRVIFAHDAPNAVKCVTQVLKALFSLNFTHLYLANLIACFNNTGQVQTNAKFSSVHNLATLSTPPSAYTKSNLFTTLVKNPLATFNAFMHAHNSLFKSDQHHIAPFQSSSNSNHQYSATNEDRNAQNALTTSSNTPTTTSNGSKLNPLNLIGMMRKKMTSSGDTSQSNPNKNPQPTRDPKLDSKTTSQYIRSFEAIVIKSLKHYTASSSCHLQMRILDLLIQLIHLKVNYALLDSDKVFIEYVLRQFDYLEQRKCGLGGSLSLANACDTYESAVLNEYEADSLQAPGDTDTPLARIYLASTLLSTRQNEHQRAHTLIPKLFEFLVVIAHERVGTEAPQGRLTVSMPKLKQICDNLLASENSPHTHVIPALRQLVYSLFLNSKLGDLVNNPATVHQVRDIELQRDVLLMTLLKLAAYPQTWHLLTIVAFKYKHEGNDDKWKRVSRQICDALFALIDSNALKFYEFNGNETRSTRRYSPSFNPYMESLKNLLQLFTYLMPQVYRPVDFILISLLKHISLGFDASKTGIEPLNQWLSVCIAHIHLLMCNSSEDVLLSRLQDLIPQTSSNGGSGDERPFMLIDDYDLLSPAIYLTKCLVKIVDIAMTRLAAELRSDMRAHTRLNVLSNGTSRLLVPFSGANFAYHLCYTLVNYLVFMCNCGFYKKLANAFHMISNNLSSSTLDKEYQSINHIIATKISKTYPLLASLWQYFLLTCGYQKMTFSLKADLNTDESLLDEEESEGSSLASLRSHTHLTLNEKLFKYATLTLCADHMSSDSNIDPSQGLTMLLISHLTDLFELSAESNILNLVSTIHRNPSASSLFLHSINSSWPKLVKLSALQSCLKTLEGVHLSVSGDLLKLLVEKYFSLPYVSLVRYADYIACQRVEMLISLPIEELSAQLNETDTKTLIGFFDTEFRYAFRHQRLISLLKKLSKRFSGLNCAEISMESNDETAKKSEDGEFLALYSSNLDKDWFYNIARSTCCVQSAPLSANTELLALKAKQCALMLANLDCAYVTTILLSRDFKLAILKECLLLGAKKTQEIVQNLPLSLMSSASSSDKEFTHPLWLAATKSLFEMLNFRCANLPSELNQQIYQSKLNELLAKFDLYAYIEPLNGAINAYIKCMTQYTCLASRASTNSDEQLHDICTFVLFQFSLVAHACSRKRLVLTQSLITESLLAIFNLLSHKPLLSLYTKRKHYVTSTSLIIRHLHELLTAYWLPNGDETATTRSNIDYTSLAPSDTFFSAETLDTLLGLKSLMKPQNPKIPFSLRDLVEKTFIAICRLPVLDQFTRVPSHLWPFYRLPYESLVKCDTPIPSIDMLKDSHVLRDYLSHVSRVGWSTRAQFENEYVSMLQLVDALCREAQSDDLPTEELKERNRCICLIIRALGSWLVHSSLTPTAGSSLNSHFELVSRNRSPTFLYSAFGKQYLNVRLLCERYSRYGSFARTRSLVHANNEFVTQALDPTLIHMLAKSIRSEMVSGDTGSVAALLNKLSVNTNRRGYYLYAVNLERALMAHADAFSFGQINLEALLKFMSSWNSANVNAIGAISEAEQRQLSSSSLANKAISNLMKVADFFSEDGEAKSGETAPEMVPQVGSTDLSPIPRSFTRAGLDLASVLRTVLDYFESYFNSNKSCLQLRYDLLKSSIYLSNTLFDSRSQYEALNAKIEANFEWINEFMSDSVNLSQMPVVNELIDDSLAALCVYSACMSKACLFSSTQTLTGKDFDRLNKMIDNCLKTSSLAMKIGAVHAIFYWLELISYGYLNNIANAGINITDYSKQMVEHLCKEVNQMKNFSVFATTNTRYISVLWSAMFFAIENCLDSIKDTQNFLNGFFKQTTNMLNDPNTPYYLFYQLFLGLERLLLTNMVPQNEINLINRIFSTKQSDEQRNLCFNTLQITILYASNQANKKTNYWNDLIQKAAQPQSGDNATISSSISVDNFDFLQPKVAQFYLSKEVLQQQSGYPQIIELQSEPELQAALLKVLEIVTGFFDKMKTCATARESHMYASVLPQLLCDFLPPHDLLNKLITEFSNSSQHPYPESIAYVLYECFSLLQEKGLQSQIQEWCLLSISNFVQRSNVSESIWLLSCFLISVSKNMWLKSTFPFVLNRYGACETIDKAIFFMAVIEFSKQLQDSAQVNSIYKTFESVAKPDTPYIELVKILGNFQ